MIIILVHSFEFVEMINYIQHVNVLILKGKESFVYTKKLYLPFYIIYFSIICIFS